MPDAAWCSTCFCVVLYGSFCHGALKPDISTLSTSVFNISSIYIIINIPPELFIHTCIHMNGLVCGETRTNIFRCAKRMFIKQIMHISEAVCILMLIIFYYYFASCYFLRKHYDTNALNITTLLYSTWYRNGRLIPNFSVVIAIPFFFSLFSLLII